ncbi:hypothetical protein CUMW_150640 [Citrus unshiu]|nr:hypothetical protein CUMW_150640 [Citrus unshiu]
MQAERKKPIAAFMAFGTKGDVYPIAAIAAAFASDQRQYDVFLITHSAHENLSFRLAAKYEGWSLAELFRVRCIVAAPYVVPYSAPASFEHRFTKEHPLLYKYLKEAPINKVCWGDVIHWMWPLFTENWGSWRSEELNLSACPFMDPVTGLPTWYDRASSPKLLYGFSKEIVECPDYWPSSVRVCGFWFLPNSWQYSCKQCGELSAFLLDANNRFMGFLKNPEAFLRVLQTVLHTTTYRFVLFTAGYEPLDTAIRVMAPGTSSVLTQRVITQYGISIFNGKLFCFSGMVPYKYLFPRCVAAIHHGGSGSTAAALHAGIPQILCPFMLDQFYWAERMFWLGVAPEPLKRNHLVPDNADDTSIKEAAEALSQAIQYALSPRVKECAKEIAERISVEDGVSEAVKNLKEEMELF